MITKIFSAAVTAVATICLLVTNAFAAQNSSVDWNKQVITVVGAGYPPAGITIPSQAKKLAERAAINDAYRQLAEIVEGVHVTGETTVQGLKLLSDTTSVKVQAVIKGAKEISSRETGDGGIEVMMQMPLFGSANSLASAVIERPSSKIPFPSPKAGVAPSRPAYNSATPVNQRIEIVVQNSTPGNVTVSRNPLNSAITGLEDWQKNIYTNYGLIITPMSKINISSLPRVNAPTQPAQIPTTPTPQIQPTAEPTEKNLSPEAKAIGGYTGIIVDCSGLELQPVMSPVIKNEDGETIYGDKNLDYDKIIELGMAAYSDGSYGLERAGKNPIVVKAVELSNFHSNPVLSVADSNRVLLENQSSRFLDNLNVVFVDSSN